MFESCYENQRVGQLVFCYLTMGTNGVILHELKFESLSSYSIGLQRFQPSSLVALSNTMVLVSQLFNNFFS